MKIIYGEAPKNAKDVARVSLVPGKTTEVYIENNIRRIAIGIDDPTKVTLRRLFIIARQVISTAKAQKIKKIALDVGDFQFSGLGLSRRELAELLGTNFEMANFEFVKYKTPPPEGWNFVEEIIVSGASWEDAKEGFRVGQVIGDEVNRCRALANTPGGEMTPRKLAGEARKAVKGLDIRVTVLGKQEMKKIGMGGVLGVAKGSDEEPQFIILEYKKGAAKEKPIVLVGKGVTFDTGGLNLKPENYMYEMHMDMSGGAAVIHTVALASRLKLKKNIVGIIPAVENMPSGSSYHPGDVLKSYSGKTIEVLNTDAEGRIILADGLAYAQKYNPRLVVDVATLTGAASAALGSRASALFTKDEKLERLFRELGEESGDFVWPLPLWDEYEEEIKGTFGDWANTGKTRYGGAITAAMFLYQFTRQNFAPQNFGGQVPKKLSKNKPSEFAYPWVHLDIAPRMTSIEGEYLAKGAAGAPMRLLIKLLTNY